MELGRLSDPLVSYQLPRTRLIPLQRFCPRKTYGRLLVMSGHRLKSDGYGITDGGLR